MKRTIVNALVILLAVLFMGRGVLPEKETQDDFRIQAFAGLPVKYEGRKKPMDTLARNLLTILSGKQSVRTGPDQKIDAVEWLLDNISGRPGVNDYNVIRIENLDVLSSLGLEERKGFRYSYNEILPVIGTIEDAARAAFSKENRERDLYDRQLIKLSNKLSTYRNVITSFEDPSGIPEWQLTRMIQFYQQLENYSIPLVLPSTRSNPRWRPLVSSLLAANPYASRLVGHDLAVDPLALHLGVLLNAYREGQVAVFNQQLDEYTQLVKEQNPDAFHKISFEVFYNRLNAFMKSAQLYLLVFVLSCFGWLFRREALLSAARTLMIVAFIPHTFAIIARVFLSGYPPVTNLYSSAIFIGWAAVAAGILFELGFRKRAGGLGNLVGGIAGFSTLLIAYFLAGDGDTMEQMRAVLDTRFWLATHVITISLGYMATFVAGTIGVFYIVAGLLTRRLDEETEDGMYRMMYGTACFALLLSFVGTVLGGLWADDSWGRFWGWDPKENGALLIVIWNAIMLHARWGMMVRHRGFAVMAVFGNVVTAWSWFGVNQLSVGLHSYGFTDSASLALTIFVIVQVVLCLFGLLPSKLWRSGAMRHPLV
jgi:ABC-type transport system involved in cytochrome c biogenesis permease subunit